MQVITTKKQLAAQIDQLKAAGKTIGLVPTMGALHQGHISLVDTCLQQTDVCVASVFVNPTQFNDPSDLERYPRDFDADSSMLEEAGCHIIFAPEVEEMYPEKDTRIFDFNGIDTMLEGAHRPGHFNGVGQIVSKLFDAVKPHKAFFGQKDFQQVAVIKTLVKIMNAPIEIVACPIVREPDGLAMSSRNLLLEPKHREIASKIYKTLTEAVAKSSEYTPDEIRTWVSEQFSNDELLELEYFDIVDDTSLQTVSSFNSNTVAVGCIAVWAGKVRLIDNIIFNC